MKAAILVIVVGILVCLGAPTYAESKDFTPCAACQFFAGAVLGQLGADRNPIHIAERLDALCPAMPSFFRATCQEWVNTYKPAIVIAVSSGASAATVCRALRVCTDNAVDLPQLVQTEKPNDGNSSGSCDLCTFIVTEVVSILAKNQTVANIQKTLNTICSFLPLGRDSCHNFVNNNLPLLIQYLSQGDTVTQVCQLIRYCKASDAIDLEGAKARLGQTPDFSNSVGGSRDCQMCTYIQQTASRSLASGVDEKDLSDSLRGVCTFLGPYQAHCEQAVQAYGDKLVHYLSKSGSEVCQQLHQCEKL